MRYCVSNWIYQNETLSKTLKRASLNGLDGIEIEGEPEKYEVGEVMGLLDQFSLKVYSVAGIFTPERDLSSPEPKIRQKAIDYVRSTLDFARAIGSGQVVVFPTYVTKTVPEGDITGTKTWQSAYRRSWDNAVNAIRTVYEHAEKVGIRLTLEPINRYETFLVNTLEQALAFREEVDAPRMGIQLDTFHMHIEEVEPWTAIRKAGDLLLSLHLSDSNRMALGKGNLDFKAMMRALMDIKFEGLLTLEPLVPCPEPSVAMLMTEDEELLDRILRDSVETLRLSERLV
jgi:D-psicose/D-tagatose/L-ribulose 3-epimerase